MKKAIFIISTILLITGCKKNSVPNPVQSEHYPQTWILTIDEGSDKYIFLKANVPVMYRDNILRTYSLTQLAIDENCEWEVSQSRTEDNSKDCYAIRLKKNKNIWVGAAPSSNQQERHLVSLNASSDPGDSYKFFIHKMPDVNGVKTVVLENVFYSGYYVSSASPGSQFAQNLATLKTATTPQQATAWQCRHN